MSKRLDPEIRNRIIELRKKGYSINEICRLVPAGKGTVSRYVQGVALLPEYAALLRKKQAYSLQKKLSEQLHADEAAKGLLGEISNRDILVFATALYWAEGNKRDVTLTNTDPELIRVFLTCLRDVFGIGSDRLRISLRVFEDLDHDECKKFWSEVTGVPVAELLPIQVLSGKKQGKLTYGMCRVRVTKGAYTHKLLTALREQFVGRVPL